ncbi:MAG: diguanylate cyclase, partial [Desulfobacula sp.]|nr:diguanylate cyclase [Desulfobacula sp.]
ESSGSVIEGIYERVRASIADHKMITRSGKVGITVSIGVARLKEGQTTDDLLAESDIALYKAKDNGRNQVVFTE